MIAQASPAAGPLRTDPSKRVNYTLGLVLGVDEFQQDQLYHAAGRRSHNRLLHGYGTVWGLGVVPVSDSADPEIQVQPGVAVDPCGREICVPDLMCVKLAKWLERHEDTLKTLYPDPEAQPIPLAVILCHRECPTDTVPVPGEPCRSQEDAMAPSRIRESFELKLALRDDAPWASPPSGGTGDLTVFKLSQPEEQAVRAFGLLLARVQTTTDPELDDEGEQTLMDGVLALKTAADEGTLASPPEPTDDPILLPAATAPDILRKALRLWVTDVRPYIRGLEDPGVCGDNDGECCVLLAEIDLNVTGDWVAAAGTIETREDRRPYLLHTRLLQEWLIAGGGDEGRPDVDTFASLQILGPNRIRVWLHHESYLDLPLEALTVVINDEALDSSQITEIWYSGLRNVWDVVINRDMLDGDVVELRFATKEIPLVYAPSEGETVVSFAREFKPVRGEPVFVADFDHTWKPSEADRTGTTLADELNGPTGEYLDRYGDSLSAFTIYNRLEGGDLRGEYDLPIVAKIQTFPVAETKPLADQYLFSNGAEWSPQYLPEGTVDLEGRYPDCEVRGLQGVPVSARGPLADQYLVFNGTQWIPRFLPNGTKDLDGRYPDSIVRGLQGVPVSSAAPGLEQYLKFDSINRQWIPADLPDARGDLVGRYPNLEIARLQKVPVAAAAPKANQALAFIGGQWVPADVAGLVGAAGGDLTGSYPAPTIARLQGRLVSAQAPNPGDFLQYRAGPTSPPEEPRWVSAPLAFGAPASDLDGTFPTVTVGRLRGRPVTAAPAAGQQVGHVLTWNGSAWINQAPAGGGGTTGPAGGDLADTYPNPRVARIQGTPVASTRPVQGQMLRFDGAQWAPGDAPTGGGAFVGAPFGPIDIIAAGQFDISDPGAPKELTGASYNLSIAFDGPVGNNASYRLSVPEFNPEQWVYIIKGTVTAGVVGIVHPGQLIIEIIPLPSSAAEFRVLELEVSRFQRGIISPAVRDEAAAEQPTLRTTAAEQPATTTTTRTTTTRRTRKPTT